LFPVIPISPVTDVYPSKVRLINELVIGKILPDILKQQLVLLSVPSVDIGSFPLHVLRGLASLDSHIKFRTAITTVYCYRLAIPFS
jgi:hypothetical protein